MAFSFGSSAGQTAAPAFGSSVATPAFGAATSQPAATGFGGFGTPASSGFGGFGAATSTAAAPAFGGFGSTATTSATPAFGGFGSTATTSAAPAFGGFGSTTATSGAAPAFGGFGTAAATSAPAFGGFGSSATTSAPTFGGFGSAATSAAPAFGGFNAKPSTGFGGFGAGAGTAGGFGGFTAPPAAPPPSQPGPQGSDAALYQAVAQCSLYNDTRDAIIGRYNLVQASWGQGKAYYAHGTQPLDLKPENPLCRFKAVAYSAIPKYENTAGLVSLLFNKKATEVEAGRTQLVSQLTQLLGNKPGVTVSLEAVKEAGEGSDVVITVSETANGQTKKCPAQDLHSFLLSKAKELQTLGVTNAIPKLGFSKKDIEEYLAEAPSGLDVRLWKQAIADNPSPDTLIPVPMLGFRALQTRLAAQESQNKAQCGRLDLLAQDVDKLNKKQADTLAALAEAKRRQLELARRVLRVLVRQETTRKAGLTVTGEEERLQAQLEGVAAELATPTQFKGRLQELLSCVRLQSQTSLLGGQADRYSLDQAAVQEVKAVLSEQQAGIQALMQCVKEDFNDLELVLSKIKSD